MAVDCYEFLDLVNSQIVADNAIHLLTVSDGSDDAGSMTFGWVISLPNGRRLAHCAGPAYGPTGSSFRAEGYGFLSVSRFLVRLCAFCSVQPNWHIQMLTDNKGLLTRLESSLPFPEPFPNLTLLSDWDVTHEISNSLRTLVNVPQLCHVKGHQDSNQAYASLPLDAQLNVDADAAAGSFQCMYPAQRPVVPRLPSNPVQLHIAGKVVCARLKQRIKEAATVPRYHEYVEKRFKWTPSITATVDWSAYTQAIARFSKQRTQVTKLCNDLLPTARWVHRYDSLTTEHCIHCGEPEDRDHILQCSHDTRRKWRASLLSKLRKAHDSDSSDHYLLDILITGLDCWFKGVRIDPARFPRRYHKLIQEQTLIGWRHLFNGHLTNEWRQKQDYFVRRRKIRTLTHTGSGWSLRTLTILWTEFLHLWKMRNESIHGHDSSTQQQARRRQLRIEIEMLHTKRDQVLASDSDIFKGDTPAELQHFLDTSSATHVQNWLHVWKPFILSSIKSAKELSLNGVQTLQTYFTPTTALPHRPLTARVHRTARPRQRDPMALPQPSYRFRSLRSFFSTIQSTSHL
jgi:hypothetical protein